MLEVVNHNRLKSKLQPVLLPDVYTLGPLTKGRGGGNVSFVGNVCCPDMAAGSGTRGRHDQTKISRQNNGEYSLLPFGFVGTACLASFP